MDNYLQIYYSLLFILGVMTLIYGPKNRPIDITYVFSGYAPLSIHLVQNAIWSGWCPIEEILKLLPGPHSEIKKSTFANCASYDALQGALMDKMTTDGRRSLVLVVFIGGVTYTKISALRFPTYPHHRKE